MFHFVKTAKQQHKLDSLARVLKAPLKSYFCIRITLIFRDRLHHFLGAKSDHSVFFFIRYYFRFKNILFFMDCLVPLT